MAGTTILALAFDSNSNVNKIIIGNPHCPYDYASK